MWPEMNPHVGFFSVEEYYVAVKHKCNHIVDFQNTVQTPNKELFKRTKLLHILYRNHIIFDMNGVMLRQNILKPLNLKRVAIFRRFAVTLINLLYYCISYHGWKISANIVDVITILIRKEFSRE